MPTLDGDGPSESQKKFAESVELLNGLNTSAMQEHIEVYVAFLLTIVDQVTDDAGYSRFILAIADHQAKMHIVKDRLDSMLEDELRELEAKRGYH